MGRMAFITTMGRASQLIRGLTIGRTIGSTWFSRCRPVLTQTPPAVSSVSPANGTTGVSVDATLRAVFSEAIDPATIAGSTFELRDAAATLVAASVAYDAPTRSARLTPSQALNNSVTYVATVKGGTSGVKDLAGNPMAADYTWTFTTAAPPPPPPDEGPGGPILVVAAAANPFGRYYAEILRNEGLNEFTVTDITNVAAEVLAGYDVVILGEMSAHPGRRSRSSVIGSPRAAT